MGVNGGVGNNTSPTLYDSGYWGLMLGNVVSPNSFPIGDAALQTGATHIAYMDGRFILNDKGTNTFRCSCLDWDGVTVFDSGAVGLLTAQADQSPDKIQGLIVVGRDLWIFGTQSFEIWYDAGTAPFPFARNISIAGQIGLYAP